MKKYQLLLTALVCLSFCTVTYAQRIGIQGGVDRTSFLGDEFNSLTARWGYNAGVYLEIPLNRSLNINPALLICLNGAKSTTPGVEGVIPDNHTFFNIHYLEVPLTVSYRFELLEGYLSVMPLAGIHGKLRLGAITTDQSWPDSVPLEEDGVLSLSSIDAGMTIGGTIEILENLQLTMEYNRGFVKIFHPEAPAEPVGYNSGFRISLRMFFTMGN
ncbi:MAG: PorT family protein [Prevotellaceae bacterium]|jgi:hypothetical protein|nr:PorT family protein [Prevotellaceae bacterium]